MENCGKFNVRTRKRGHPMFAWKLALARSPPLSSNPRMRHSSLRSRFGHEKEEIMKQRLLIALLALAAVLLNPAAARAATAATSKNVQLVGQNPLFNRGLNAAATIFHHFLYVGNRTDGSSRCGIGDPRRAATGLDSCPHPHPGILILDIKNPSNPTVVNEFGTEFTTGAFAGQTSRELRVWPEKKLLMVTYFRCSSFLHACTRPAADDWRIKFFDLKDPVHPQFISNFVPTSKAGVAVKPHEMFLWVDPKKGNRALLFLSTPALETDPATPNLVVIDISQVPKGGAVTEVAEGNWNNRFPGTDQANYPFDAASPDGCGPYDCNLFVHSMGVKPDGSRTYLALEAGHFLVLDTGDIANNTIPPGTVLSLNDKLLTDPTNRPVWLQDPLDPAAVPGVFPGGCARQGPGPSSKDCPNSHSAVQVLGRRLALSTDEVYGTFTFDNQGCRWGWARLIDVADPAHPSITGEFLLDQNQLSFCGSAGDTAVSEQFRSFSTHNPTVFRDLALIDWHSNGFQAIDISDPAHPSQAGFFRPTPIPVVANEDPGLSQGPATTVDQLLHPDVNNPDFKTKIVMWSYPIIKDGLIYVIDVRNGLFILRYTGPHADEVNEIEFLEGNSNLGDAVDLDEQD